MEYRKLGRTGLDVSAIGLGTEHLEQSRKTMEEVLGTAVDAGVNYIDLLWVDAARYGYDTDFWDEFGPVLKHYRDKFILTPRWGEPVRYDMDFCQRCFDDLLLRLGTDHAEVAMLMMFDSEKKWDGWIQESVEHLNRYKEQGRVGYIGGSAHDASIAMKAVNSGLLDVLMFPVNIFGYNDKKNSALYQTLYQACVDHGVGFVAMKPYAGGTLFVADGKPSGITPVQCLSYVLSLPVSTTVPGPKNAEELRATLHYLEATNEEKNYLSAIESIPTVWRGLCIRCGHCQPCPQGIDIRWMIRLVDRTRGGITDELMAGYSNFQVKASECTECGECMERCPFEVDVIAKMQRAVEIFEAKAG
jgi:predicted aldo/keto reductase-like oxidoreductase